MVLRNVEFYPVIKKKEVRYKEHDRNYFSKVTFDHHN